MVKSDVEIDEIKGELRDWLDEKGVIGVGYVYRMWKRRDLGGGIDEKVEV